MPRYEQYAPEFRIRINGDEMPAQVRAAVTSVRYEDGTKSADRVEIGIANSDLRMLRKHIRGLGFQPLRRFLNSATSPWASALGASTHSRTRTRQEVRITEALVFVPGAATAPLFRTRLTGQLRDATAHVDGLSGDVHRRIRGEK